MASKKTKKQITKVAKRIGKKVLPVMEKIAMAALMAKLSGKGLKLAGSGRKKRVVRKRK